MSQSLINALIALSNKYGADPSFVLAGGGNTSAKTRDTLWVKPSGVSLATMKAADLVAMNREQLDVLFATVQPDCPVERETRVKAAMLAAVRTGTARRPSVEAPLHHLFDATLVVHTHPALVNGMTCAKDGETACSRLFPDALWVPYIDPGYCLALLMKSLLATYKAEHGAQPQLVFLQNHGLFVAANTPAAIDALHARVITTLASAYRKARVATSLASSKFDARKACSLAPRLRILMGGADRVVVASSTPFPVARGPLTPDHIVYAKSFPFTGSIVPDAFDAFENKHDFRPVIVSRPGAVFAAGTSLHAAETAMALARDAALVAQLAPAFGGVRYMDNRSRAFIENWEVENYRKSVSLPGARGRLAAKIALVTGAAQGFGKGIAEHLAAEGALVVIADVNLDGATACADALCRKHGSSVAFPVQVDIASESSVQAMIAAVVARCGGLDLFVANAGVLRAGSVKTMSMADWDLVTKINYTGYFLCVKHASTVMAQQNIDGRGSWMDIVQINSKSGLQGSNKNGAYAGSKFGTIGLTQSFAKELVEDRIKVNSICPGNYFEGPLWSDPVNGLFRQYLDAGKVPGAKTIDQVKQHYERQVPMGRGCMPADVARAIIYCVEQQYETGQAIPVSGGQVMLK